MNKEGPIPAHRPELGPCWEWIRFTCKIPGAYPQFWTGVAKMAAHRFSWELSNGPIPTGMWVLHHCDNPRCVRPDHLFLGTRLDNIRDMQAKGRLRNGWMGKALDDVRSTTVK